MTTFKMTLQYDGTRYSGWQKQGNTTNTIQEKIESIASYLFGKETDVNGSGRTDAGVHARGQVASLKGKWPEKNGIRMTCDEIRDYFNEKLPLDIRVMEVDPATDRFHARLNAVSKHYRYTVDCGQAADVFMRKYSTHSPKEYNIDAMQQAAALLCGKYDFKSFCENKHMKKSTVREIFDIAISKDGNMIHLDYYGDGFLYHMVRILTGTILEVGEGLRDPMSMSDIIDAKDRAQAGPTAPPQGLCLMEVKY